MGPNTNNNLSSRFCYEYSTNPMYFYDFHPIPAMQLWCIKFSFQASDTALSTLS